MARKPDPYLNNVPAQVCRVIVGVLIIVPTLIRWAEGPWAVDDRVLFIAGVALTLTWVVLMIVGARRRELDEFRKLSSE
ncbi:hypothetical protein [Arthrobacter sp. CP30]